ncbi:MAG: PrsW family intramembrane metalloprotease [Phaeodactylibacter sp.]|nr:PrsW family intramembrane metalloprotease [Phaeodactylibacter sp.]MCB9303168.1 PrsW family intramembrane metalloprotease [Lewinellaceae bacterium]
MIEDSLLLLLALFPGLLICWYIYQMDKYEKESRLQLAITFLLGMLVTYPVLRIESWAFYAGWDDPSHLGVTLVSSFVVVALTEELAKFLVLLAYPYPRAFFNEPMDGIVYAVMISMGFATLENILYAGKFGFGTTILRAFTAVPAHASFAIIMGYFVGQSKFTQPSRKRNQMLVLGLAVPLGIHGVYDFFILQEAYEELMILALIVLGASIYLARRMVLDQQERSPFKEE